MRTEEDGWLDGSTSLSMSGRKKMTVIMALKEFSFSNTGTLKGTADNIFTCFRSNVIKMSYLYYSAAAKLKKNTEIFMFI